MNEIIVSDLLKFKPMNNNVLIKHISDSIEDVQRNNRINSKILIVRNEGNKLREKSVGEVINCSDRIYVGNIGSRLEISLEDVMNKVVLYDTHSRLSKIRVKDSSQEYYLVRFPDIIAILEEE